MIIARRFVSTSFMSLLLVGSAVAQGTSGEDAPYEQSPWWPYLSAHMNDESPPTIVGGPIEISITQEEGAAVNWVLPSPRELDPTIFGTADEPKATEPPPIGVPVAGRETRDGRLVTANPVPASDKAVAVDGMLNLRLVDQTATDAAITEDQIDLVATFAAPDGSGTYRIEVNEPLPHGWYSPTVGGVGTNLIMHGVTKWENQIMPTFFAFAAFWGLGDIYLDDELIAEDRLIHGMLTEGIRGEQYEMVMDENVSPDYHHFHLMAFPHTAQGEPDPIPSGYMLEGGMEQPVFHIMYDAPTVEGLTAEQQ
jgi:hypothetical protein